MVINPFEGVTGYLLRQISVADVRQLAVELKRLNLRPADAMVIRIVETNQNIPQAIAGQMIGIAAPNMVKSISALLKRGIIERQPRDGRTHGLHLTTNGAVLARRVNKVFVDHEKAFIAELPAAYRKHFQAALLSVWTKIQVSKLTSSKREDRPNSRKSAGGGPAKRGSRARARSPK